MRRTFQTHPPRSASDSGRTLFDNFRQMFAYVFILLAQLDVGSITSGPTNRVSSVPPETEVRASCPVGRNEGVHTSVPLVRYKVVSTTSGCLHPSLFIEPIKLDNIDDSNKSLRTELRRMRIEKRELSCASQSGRATI